MRQRHLWLLLPLPNAECNSLQGPAQPSVLHLGPQRQLAPTGLLPPFLPLTPSYEGRWVREYVDATVPEMAFGEYWDTCSYSGALRGMHWPLCYAAGLVAE